MTLREDEVVSAQVVLRPASGRQIDLETLITADNISQYEPSQETVEESSRAFRSLGFEVGSMVGISFSITAPARIFEYLFKVHLRRTNRGGIEYLSNDGVGRLELPLINLTEDLARHLHTVTFIPPPDSGPTDY